MLRRLLLLLTLVAALALPVQAVAKTKSYSGAVTPSGTVGFKVKAKHGKKQVKNFRFDSIPVTCDSGTHTTYGNVTFTVKLRKGKFNISATSTATGASLDIHGNVGGNSASGTLSVTGKVPIDAGPSDGSSCSSGALSWTAAR